MPVIVRGVLVQDRPQVPRPGRSAPGRPGERDDQIKGYDSVIGIHRVLPQCPPQPVRVMAIDVLGEEPRGWFAEAASQAMIGCEVAMTPAMTRRWPHIRAAAIRLDECIVIALVVSEGWGTAMGGFALAGPKDQAGSYGPR
jgi:hypothetical protein